MTHIHHHHLDHKLSPQEILVLFFLGVLRSLRSALSYVRHHVLLLPVLLSIVLIFVASNIPGSHQPALAATSEFLYYVGYWVVLGLLSSVGLGTGLHTFVLYLGPHIASVTMAAAECRTTDFDTRGPNAFICPPGDRAGEEVAFLAIVQKVVFTAFLWGAGTALGELPPYFIARSARRQGARVEELDEELNEVGSGTLGVAVHTLKTWIYTALLKYGFIAILLFASIPNPLFDLAGLTCGTVGVPFYTFFGATLIGKAVVKASLQTVSVILLFERQSIAVITSLVQSFDAKVILPLDELISSPPVGAVVGVVAGVVLGYLLARVLGLEKPTSRLGLVTIVAVALGSTLFFVEVSPISPLLDEYFAKQHEIFHKGPDPNVKKPVIAQLFNVFLAVFIGYFVVSMVKSVAEGEAETRALEKRKGTTAKNS